jgi:hypothetical protein
LNAGKSRWLGIEEGAEGFVLAEAELEGEEAAGAESWVWWVAKGLGDEAAVDVEAGGAGEEGGVGLVVTDFGVEGRGVGEGNVGRVGDDGIEGHRLVGKCAEKIAMQEGDAVDDAVGEGVFVSDGQGRCRDVEGACGRWVARARAMAPVPVPTSMMRSG